jgi:hypothetical protein
MFKKVHILIITTIIFLFCNILMIHDTNSYGYQGENIIYVIKPLGGKAEYLDLGLTDFEGRKVNLTVFKTNVFGFKDTEKIYSDQETLLPIRVERDVSWWFGKENITEEYNQKDFKVTIIKFKRGKKISEQVLSADGPISHAVIVPFYLRKVTDMKVGWSFIFRLPQKYEARLVSLDEVKVMGRKFSTYHFTIIPDKFEIWISKDDARIPLKIKGKGGLNYTLLMKEHNMPSVH